MKKNHLFDPKIGIHFNLEHYAGDISKKMAYVLEPAAWKKQPFWQQLQIWIVLALKTLSRLQRSKHFRRETQWQSQFADSIAALTNPALLADEMIVKLQQANDVIEAAYKTSMTRTAIATAVKGKTLLSPEQEKQYQAVRRRYESQNTRLNQLADQVLAIRETYNGSRRCSHQVAITFSQSSPISLPPQLFSYHQKKERYRVIEDSLKGIIRTEDDSRTLYQALGKQLIEEKPTLEKMTDDSKTARSFLQQKSQLILTHTHALRVHIDDHLRDAIEHRSQMMRAHAHQQERLLANLDNMMMLLQPLVSTYDQPGRLVMTEIQRRQAPAVPVHREGFFASLPEKGRLLANLLLAVCVAKSAVGAKKLTPEQATDLQQKVEAIGAAHTRLTAGMTSSWSAFFSSASRLQREQELSLKTKLDAELTQIAHVTYSLKDVNTVITPEQVQGEQHSAEQLEALEAPIAQEQKSIAQAPIAFGR